MASPHSLKNMASAGTGSPTQDNDAYAPKPPPRRSAARVRQSAAGGTHVGAGVVFGLPDHHGANDSDDDAMLVGSDDGYVADVPLAPEEEEDEDRLGANAPLLGGYASPASGRRSGSTAGGRRGRSSRATGVHASRTSGSAAATSGTGVGGGYHGLQPGALNSAGLSGASAVTDTDDEVTDADGDVNGHTTLAARHRSLRDATIALEAGAASIHSLAASGVGSATRSLPGAGSMPINATWLGTGRASDTETEDDVPVAADLLPEQPASAPENYPPRQSHTGYPVNTHHLHSGTHFVPGGHPGARRGGYGAHLQSGSVAPGSRSAMPRRDGLKHIPRMAGMGFLPARRRTSRRPGAQVSAGTNMLETLSDLDEVAAMPQPKRVSGYCIAQAFEWTDLVEHLASLRATHTHMNDDVVRLHLPHWPPDGEAFLFGTYGVIIFWAMEKEEETRFLDSIRGWLDQDNVLGDDEEEDEFYWFYNMTSEDSTAFVIWNNYFILPKPLTPEAATMDRLAVSYSIATSVKLDTFEVAIEKTIEATQSLPLELANEGRMTLSKKEVSKYIGELYIQKSSVNLIHDILDTPDFFWDQQDLEKVYIKCRKFLNIDTRCEVLNKRLDVLAELLDILRTEKSEQHSSRLEWIVIWLIVVEIVLGLFDILYNIFANGHLDVI